MNVIGIRAALRDEIRLIASGKMALGFALAMKAALGADMFNAAHPFMFYIGCVQVGRCQSNNCPTGVISQE